MVWTKKCVVCHVIIFNCSGMKLNVEVHWQVFKKSKLFAFSWPYITRPPAEK